jgi:hypothetical protein
MRLLVVRGKLAFPAVCFNCAQPARKMIKVDVSNVDAGVSIGRVFFSILVPFGRLFTAFDAAKRDVFIQLKLPICNACRKRGARPEVQSYDLESREIRLIVHEHFREQVMPE